MKNKKTRSAFLIALLVVLIVLIVVKTLLPANAQAAWFDNNWAFRQKIPLTSKTGSTETNVYFVANSFDSSDTTKFQADCGDLRFTDANGNLLQYFISSGCGTGTTVVHVLVPSLLTTAQDFYMYYGNPLAPNGFSATDFTASSGTVTLGANGSEELGAAPIMYYKFDDGTGTTTSDSSTNANTGTLGGTTKPTWQSYDFCISSNCLFFDGSSSKVTGSKIAKAVKSVSVWVKPNNFAAAGTLVDLDGGTHKLSVAITTGVVTATGFTSPTYYLNGKSSSSPITLIANQWNYVVVTTGTSFDSTATFTVGTDGTNYTKGFIDEVKFYNYALSQNQVNANLIQNPGRIGSSAQLGSSTTAYLNQNLVGYWKFDENTGSTTTDTSGNGDTGTWNGTLGSQWVAGKYGSGGSFNGSDNYVDATNGSALSISGAGLTVSAWINPSVLTGRQMLVAKDASGTDSYFLSMDQTDCSTTGKIEFSVNTTSRTGLCASTALSTGTWYHIVATYDGVKMYLYINGKLDNSISKTGNIATNTLSLTIGDWNTFNRKYTGLIDEVRVYSRALSSIEATNLFSWGPAPVGYWNLEENTGTTANDLSTNANTGSITAGTGGWVPGKFGSAYNFDDANTLINCGTGTTLTNLKSGAGLTAEAWIYPKSSGEGGAAGGVIVDKATGVTGGAAGTPKGWFFYITTSNDLEFTHDGSTILTRITSTTVTLNTWNHVAVTWDGSTTAANSHIYINGIEAAYATTTNGVSLNSDSGINLNIGNDSSQADTFDGFVDEVRVYNYPRAGAQIVEDMNGGHPAGGSPVGSQTIYWKLDEDQGTTANNSVTNGSALNGTTSGIVWLTNASCKVNGCLSFDTSTDNVSAGDTAFTDSLTGFTTSFWINPQTLATNKSIISKNNTSQKSFAIVTDGSDSSKLRVHIAASAGEADNTTYCTTPTGTLVASAWEYITVVYDGTQITAANRVTVYKNGIGVTCNATGTFPTSMTSGSTSNLKLGDDDSATYSSLLMYLDEVKIYNFALNSNQILVDYNAGASANYGTGASTEASTLSDGTGAAPQIYWSFEEAGGTSANDVSGNGNTGTITTGSYVTGKNGDAISMTATTSNVSAGDVAFVDGINGLSTSFWLNPQSLATNKMIISKANNTTQRVFQIKTDDTTAAKLKVMISSSTSDTSNYCVTSASVLSTLTWQYISVVYDGTQSTGDDKRIKVYVNGSLSSCTVTGTIPTTLTSGTTSNLKAGQGDDTTPTSIIGFIDDAKIYNYARTAAQVDYDYNRGAPFAMWKFDECQGTTINDSSGNSYTGTLTVGASGTQTLAGTCNDGNSAHAWANGATGKFNASINLDGTDDKVNVPNNSVFDFTTSFSISLWFNLTSTASNQTFVEKAGVGVNPDYYAYWNVNDVSPNNSLICGLHGVSFWNASYVFTPTTGTWYHMVCVYDVTNTTSTEYLNGKSVATQTIGTPVSTTNSMDFGHSPSGSDFWLNGKLDNIRFYNYALSATQIKAIYNQGSSVRFGPATGNP